MSWAMWWPARRLWGMWFVTTESSAASSLGRASVFAVPRKRILGLAATLALLRDTHG
jgi:hypothetical protein